MIPGWRVATRWTVLRATARACWSRCWTWWSGAHFRALLTLEEHVTYIYSSSTSRETDASPSSKSLSLVAELINKALNVAQLILRDEKYRTIVAKTPNLINRLLCLLERLDTSEAKRLVLRVIGTLGESEESKIEIGRHQGFRKILKLLVEGDEELTSEIIRTLKQFLRGAEDVRLFLFYYFYSIIFTLQAITLLEP